MGAFLSASACRLKRPRSLGLVVAAVFGLVLFACTPVKQPAPPPLEYQVLVESGHTAQVSFYTFGPGCQTPGDVLQLDSSWSLDPVPPTTCNPTLSAQSNDSTPITCIILEDGVVVAEANTCEFLQGPPIG
jgi:hypothetical protein